MNPYRPPGSPTTIEDDIAAAAAPAVARVAGGLVLLAGIVVAATGLQTLAMVVIGGPMAPVPYGLVVLGVPGVVLGALVFRARPRAVVTALGQTGLATLVSAAWLVISFSHGLFTLFALAAPFCAIAAFVLLLLAMGPCQRVGEARARLRQQGMNLGI